MVNMVNKYGEHLNHTHTFAKILFKRFSTDLIWVSCIQGNGKHIELSPFGSLLSDKFFHCFTYVG